MPSLLRDFRGEFGDDGCLLGVSNIKSVSRVATLPPMPSIVSSSVGEFGDDGRLLGLSNIESLHCLLPKPGLVSGFLVAAGYWTASVGSLLLLHSSSPPSQRFFFSFVSFSKNVGTRKSSFIPIFLRCVFTRLSEGNLDGSWTIDTLATSTLPTTPARRPPRKDERQLLSSIVVSFVFTPVCLRNTDRVYSEWAKADRV
jgi:hypothetical protein